MSSNETGFRVEERDGRGRCLVATKKIAKGEVAAVETALCAIPMKPDRSQFSLMTGKGLKCSKTKYASYLTKEEQKLDWVQGFREESSAMVKMWSRDADSSGSELKVLPTILRLAARLAWMSKKEPSLKLKLGKLVEHSETFDESYSETFTTMSRGLIEYVNEASSGFNPEELFNLLARLTCNVHTITDWSINPIGLGIFLEVGCLVNHSDDPNCVQIFELRKDSRPKMRLVALRDVSPGEEITISYVDPAECWLNRYAILHKQYSIPYEEHPRPIFMNSAYVLMSIPKIACRDGADVLQVRYAPDGLPQVGIPSELIMLDDEDPLDVVVEKHFENQLSAILKKSHSSAQINPLARRAESLFLSTLLREMNEKLANGQFERALELGKQASLIMQNRLPDGWPLLGLHAAALTKLDFYFAEELDSKETPSEDIEQLRNRAQESLMQLSICFGENAAYVGEQLEARATFDYLGFAKSHF